MNGVSPEVKAQCDESDFGTGLTGRLAKRLSLVLGSIVEAHQQDLRYVFMTNWGPLSSRHPFSRHMVTPYLRANWRVLFSQRGSN